MGSNPYVYSTHGHVQKRLEQIKKRRNSRAVKMQREEAEDRVCFIQENNIDVAVWQEEIRRSRLSEKEGQNMTESEWDHLLKIRTTDADERERIMIFEMG